MNKSRAFVFIFAVLIHGITFGQTTESTAPNQGDSTPKPKTKFLDDFEAGIEHWKTTDSEAWTLTKDENTGKHVFGLNKRISNYEPKYRSPHNIALLDGFVFESFELTFDVKSTLDTGDHRDCCIFFGYQNPTQFYYAHLGAKPDPASGQIMIVDNAARTPLTTNKKKVDWNDDWHHIKLVRDFKTGKIEIYFDDMDTPQMAVEDQTFGSGQVGLGSFDDMNDFDNFKIFER